MSASSCQLCASSNMALACFMVLTMPFISIKRENCQAILINDRACNIATELKSLGGINGHLSRFHFANFYHSAITLIQPSVFDRLLAVIMSWFRLDPNLFYHHNYNVVIYCQQWKMGNIPPTVQCMCKKNINRCSNLNLNIKSLSSFDNNHTLAMHMVITQQYNLIN